MERCPRGAVELGISGFVCFWFGVLVFVGFLFFVFFFFKAKLTAVLVISCKITKLHLFTLHIIKWNFDNELSYTIGEGANVALPFLKVFSVTCGAFVSLDKAGDMGKRLYFTLL